MTAANTILAITVTLTALSAGIFYAWSVSVTLGLKRLSDQEYVSFMQETNRAIQNPWFFVVFFGAAILLPVSSYLNYGQSGRFELLLAATIVYLVGVIGVTIFGNVPMNERLDRFEMESATDEEIKTQRKNYEGRWNFLNNIRTICSTIAIALVIIACLN